MQARDYQLQIAGQACELLRSFKIAYLCMEVRTGKTLTSFETARLYGAKKVLFVTKLKAISSIQKDYQTTKPGFDLYVINYEQLHKCESGWDLVIIDEAHALSQFPTPAERTKQLKRICAGLPIIYLSGTPSPESYSQFYQQFWVSSFSPFSGQENFYKWHKLYGIPKVKYLYNRQIADYSQTKKEEVLSKIKHLMLAYTQEEAGFTAPVEESIIKIPMAPNIAWAIKTLKRDKIFTTKGGDVVLGDTAVKEMNKVHQLCSGTVKTEDGNAIIIDYSKAKYIDENFKGRKIAIFYKYIAEEMQLRVLFNGRLFTDPMEFNRAGKDAIFISQVQSGREGINISTADCIIMYNIDFSAVSYWQARARLQLMERTDPAYVYWLFTEGGIEEEIYKVVQLKKDFTLSHYRKTLGRSPASVLF